MFKTIQGQLNTIIIIACVSASMALMPQTAFALSPEEAHKIIQDKWQAQKDAKNLVLELAYRNAPEEELRQALLQLYKLENEMGEAAVRKADVQRSIEKEET